uniref:Neuromedin Bb n=1 Tax=Nothobranchius furzeri TaxID=105023 RepID=A0A8C6KNQ1_NOTFU
LTDNVCQCGLFTYLVLFSFMSLTAAVSFDLTELRNKVAKIKVNPRGNLWATGHFMGKKSVMDSPLLSPPEEQGLGSLEVSLPADQSSLGELFHEFLRVALQAQTHSGSLLPSLYLYLLIYSFQRTYLML